MLLLISALILYTDIFVGSVNVVPDIVGYLLLIPAFFTIRTRFRLNRRLLVYAVLGILLEALLFLITDYPVVTVVFYLLLAVLEFLIGLRVLQDLTSGLDRSEEPMKTRLSICRTALLFMFLVTLFALPLSVFPLFRTILRIVSIPLAWFFVWQLYRFYSSNE